MTLQILKGLLQGYMKSLFDEGVVSDQFNVIMSLKRIGETDRAVQMIETYFADVEKILFELSRHVDNPTVDFSKLASLAREIEDKSASIGAEHMRLACPDIIKACDEKNHQSFSRSLPWLKNEFSNTRNKLAAFVQMERRIIRIESSQSSASSSQASTSGSQSPK
ncbi:histidine-containing phosphotransfer protein 1-like [Cajanus cajan]|uniref:histidine-containing phosphotransfer protein 1-like n=1 Tax=Cajanus cajan TaxID=3821 RepID=UPI00098D813C|nr:histidine-containing phosphotransfer protein 1-like [Cajanus cajan]